MPFGLFLYFPNLLNGPFEKMENHSVIYLLSVVRTIFVCRRLRTWYGIWMAESQTAQRIITKPPRKGMKYWYENKILFKINGLLLIRLCNHYKKIMLSWENIFFSSLSLLS